MKIRVHIRNKGGWRPHHYRIFLNQSKSLEVGNNVNRLSNQITVIKQAYLTNSIERNTEKQKERQKERKTERERKKMPSRAKKVGQTKVKAPVKAELLLVELKQLNYINRSFKAKAEI